MLASRSVVLAKAWGWVPWVHLLESAAREQSLKEKRCLVLGTQERREMTWGSAELDTGLASSSVALAKA